MTKPTHHLSLLALVVFGGAAALAADAASAQTAVSAPVPDRCVALAADQQAAARKQAHHRAMMGFARGLAGSLPMLGGGVAGSVATSVAGQTASAALEGGAVAPDAHAAELQRQMAAAGCA